MSNTPSCYNSNPNTQAQAENDCHTCNLNNKCSQYKVTVKGDYGTYSSIEEWAKAEGKIKWIYKLEVSKD